MLYASAFYQSALFLKVPLPPLQIFRLAYHRAGTQARHRPGLRLCPAFCCVFLFVLATEGNFRFQWSGHKFSSLCSNIRMSPSEVGVALRCHWRHFPLFPPPCFFGPFPSRQYMELFPSRKGTKFRSLLEVERPLQFLAFFLSSIRVGIFIFRQPASHRFSILYHMKAALCEHLTQRSS